MRNNEYFVVKKKKAPGKSIFVALSALVTAATAATVAYKFLKNKTASKVLGHVDIDGDGEAEAIMLDTTGDGMVDTIIINTDPEEVNEKVEAPECEE